MGIARATLIGNLTADPRGNTAETVCNLRVAVNTRRKVDDEWTDVPNYFDVVALGTQAKNCLSYLKKGRQVAVDGNLQWREWTDKEGNKRQSVEILANEVQFIGGRPDDDSSSSSSEDAGW